MIGQGTFSRLAVTPAPALTAVTPVTIICFQIPLIRLLFFLTYLLTPWSRVLLEKLTGLQLVKKFPAFYGTRRFITAIKIPANSPNPEPARYSPYPTSHFLKIHVNIILQSTPRTLGLVYTNPTVNAVQVKIRSVLTSIQNINSLCGQKAELHDVNVGNV
jgi:hypothetical protein